MSHILVTGSSKGLGRELVEALRRSRHTVYPYDRAAGYDVLAPDVSHVSQLDVLINNAGVNIIDWLERVREVDWDQVMGVNAKGVFMMTQACLPLLIKSQGTVINIISNAAHMPMTCSLVYNASKGAAYIMTLQLARELTRKYGITVFGIAPNKMAGTGMSEDIDRQVVRTRGWTREYAHDYQLQGLLTGEETPPQLIAMFIAYLLQDKQHHKFLTGTVIPYGA